VNNLIITWSMIPFVSGWGGSQRIYYLAEEMVKKGSRVDVVCCAPHGRKVYQIKEKIHFNIFGLDFRGNKITQDHFSEIENDQSVIESGIKKSMISVMINWFLRLPNLIFNESNFRTGSKIYMWIQINKKAILNIAERGKYDYAIISGPPHTLFFLAPILKKSKVKVVLDYRDPWNLWRTGYPISSIKEKKFLGMADLVVCTNENMKVSLAKKYGVNSEKIHVVGNGYSVEKWRGLKKNLSVRSQRDTFKISYVGSINLGTYAHFRDCTELLEAWDSFRQNKNVKLCFIGVNDYNKLDLINFNKRQIEVKGQVSVDASFAEMQDTDVLLVMHTAEDESGKYIVSAKLYDYIRAGTYILAIGHPQDIHKKIVEELSVGMFSENKKSAIEEALECLYVKWKNHKLCLGQNDIEAFSREYQNMRYIELLGR
jgi:glycosyltransferase involved in cell wall biosynthesis